jgi:ATP-dependent DNA ligase
VLPEGSEIVSEAVSVTGSGCELFDLMCANVLEGIVAKRLADRYDTRARWLKTRTAHLVHVDTAARRLQFAN